MQKKSRSSSTKKSAPKRRKAKKAKVALDTKKLMFLCAAVCASCALLLAVTAFFSRGNVSAALQSGESVKKEISVQPENSAQKENSEKIKKEEKAAQKKSEKKQNPSELVEKPAPQNKDGASKSKPAEKKASEEKKSASPSKEEKPALSDASEKSAASSPKAPAAPAAPEKKDFGFPFAKNGAVLSIIFDDGGQRLDWVKKCVALPFPVTVAVLPRLAHSAESAAVVRQSGNEVILHQPMQAVNLKVNPGEGAIKPEMTSAQVQAVLAQNIAEIAPIAGMNNHEGSLITEDEVLVSFVLETARKKGIYFLDSRTSSATKVPSVAMEMGMGWYQRDIFLDNQKTRENYLAELKKGLEIANKKGHVIMIGHVWSAESLPAFLEEAYPELALKGYRFSVVSKSGGMMR